MVTRVYRPFGIIVACDRLPSARPAFGVYVRGAAPGAPEVLILHDAGEDGVRLTVEDKPVDRYELIRWFDGARSVRLEVDRGDDGSIVEARFSAAS